MLTSQVLSSGQYTTRRTVRNSALRCEKLRKWIGKWLYQFFGPVCPSIADWSISNIRDTLHCHNKYSSQLPVKQSLYRPGQALRVPTVWVSQISTQSTTESTKVVSPTQRPIYSPRKYPWYSFLSRLQGFSADRRIMSMKNRCPSTDMNIVTVQPQTW